MDTIRPNGDVAEPAREQTKPRPIQIVVSKEIYRNMENRVAAELIRGMSSIINQRTTDDKITSHSVALSVFHAGLNELNIRIDPES